MLQVVEKPYEILYWILSIEKRDFDEAVEVMF
jgi:hypothetical protein